MVLGVIAAQHHFELDVAVAGAFEHLFDMSKLLRRDEKDVRTIPSLCQYAENSLSFWAYGGWHDSLGIRICHVPM